MAYINAEDTRAIRNALKAKYGKTLKFQVKKRGFSQVCVTVVGGEIDFGAMLKNPNYPEGYVQVNEYWLERTGEFEPLFQDIINIIKTAPSQEWFDDTDAMTDYFHCAFYFNVAVGDWSKPYALKAAA